MDTLMERAEELVDLGHDSFRAILAQISQDWVTYGDLFSITTAKLPDLDALELEAEEHRDTLRLAAELEVLNLRNENQQLSHLANRDRLTGLFNRGAFDDALEAGVAAAARQSSSLALLMIDLDRFKSINDDHGHPVGDEALRHITRIFYACTRPPAEVFRYGGDEFVVLIPAADEVKVGTMVGALRQAINESPYKIDAKTISLTVSIGVIWACWPEHAMTSAALVQAADQQLYEAKQAGRNTHRFTQSDAPTGRR
jgi:diguanylate cyclase (GGDEF)-like protein